VFYATRRDLALDFTQPYTVTGHISVVREGEGGPPVSVEELAGMRIAVQRAVLMHDFAAEYGFAVPAGNRALLAQLGEGLQVLEKPGECRRIREKWLGVYEEGPVTLLAALRLFGAESAGQMLGTPVMDRVHPSVRDAIGKRIRELNALKKQVPANEETHLRLDGTEVPVEVSAVPFTYEGSDGALVFVRDISERKRAEVELLREESPEQRRESLLEIRKAAKRSVQLTRQLPAFARRQTVGPGCWT
jgi:PAS domain S-box-containing protein